MDKLVKGLTIIAAGSIAITAVKTIRERKLQKELYENAEVAHDEQSDKE